MRETKLITPEHIYAKARFFSEGAVIDREDTKPPALRRSGAIQGGNRGQGCCEIFRPGRVATLRVGPSLPDRARITESLK
jgi:hypothetical protein